jgi:xanthosine utilization system XapX-like protein
MFLSTLSASIVALGLIAGIAGFGDAFFVFALVILPVVLFVGIGTWLRMGASNYHDAIAVAGMNRIRAAYLEIAPDLEPYFVMGVHDDPPGIGLTMAVPPGTPIVVHLIAGTPSLVVVLNGIIAGAIASLVALRTMAPATAALVLIGLLVAVLAIGLQVRVASRNIRRGQRALRPMFPTPGVTPDPDALLGSRIPYGPSPDDVAPR